MKLEQQIYQLPIASERRQQTYFVVGDLESLSASAFYTGEPCGKNFVFKSASKLGLGPGIAREMLEAGKMIERVRKDNDSPSHLNYEYLIPGKKKKFITIANLHIPLDDD